MLEGNVPKVQARGGFRTINKNQGMSKYVGACEDTYFPILLSDSTIFDKFTIIFYVLQKDQNSTEHIILQYQDNPRILYWI